MNKRIKRLFKAGVLGGGGGKAPLTAKIYGVSWSGAQSPALTRTDDAVGMAANAGVDAGVVINDFDTAEIYSEITEVTDAAGNVFVRIPKFYINKTATGAARTWQISKDPYPGFYLPWCFWDFTTSKALAYVDVGKYAASLDGSNRLESKSGKYPLVYKNIVDFRGYAEANGAGYQQFDIHVVDLLQTLFYVEYATLHSQSVMNGWVSGQHTATHLAVVAENNTNRIVVPNATAAPYAVGQPIGIGTSQGGNQICYGRTITAIDIYDDLNKFIEFDGAAVNIAVGNYLYNVGWLSGACDGVAASSGSVASNSDGKHPFIYRGIENIWGSVYQFVDGLNVNAWQSWVCKDAEDYASDLFAAPYEQLAFANVNTNGYLTQVGVDPALPFANLPTAIGGDAGTYYSDYYYQSTDQHVAILGGSWNGSSNAGLSFWNLGSTSSSADLRIGGRLVKKAL